MTTSDPPEISRVSALLVSVGGALMQAGVLKAASCGGAASYSEVGAGGNRDWILSQLTKLPYTSFGVADSTRYASGLQ
ncbi:hypothetical protein [Nonomuraea helvata]|uniref:Uncharacterized protein n=1 Tax=Nonomuraea helvata TaxID=37484 RepID=A0ABV5S1A3_9ACTN